MEQKPKISIITPTYNQAELLKKCIFSVKNQSFTSWELIIVDNYSEDETESVVNSFCDSRIKYFKNKNYGVIANSRNFAIQRASGDWLAFLDSDDYWEVRKLEICYSTLLRENVGAVCHGEFWLYENGEKTPKIYGTGFEHDFEDLYTGGNKVSTSAVVVSRADVLRVGGFSEKKEFVTSEDFHLWLRLLRSGVDFYFIPEILGTYLIHNMGNSYNIERNINAVYEVVTTLGERFELSSSIVAKAQSVTFLGAARLHSERASLWSCFTFVKKSIFCNPFSLMVFTKAFYFLFLALARKPHLFLKKLTIS